MAEEPALEASERTMAVHCHELRLNHIVKIWKGSALEVAEKHALEASGLTMAVLKSLIY